MARRRRGGWGAEPPTRETHHQLFNKIRKIRILKNFYNKKKEKKK